MVTLLPCHAGNVQENQLRGMILSGQGSLFPAGIARPIAMTAGRATAGVLNQLMVES